MQRLDLEGWHPYFHSIGSSWCFLCAIRRLCLYPMKLASAGWCDSHGYVYSMEGGRDLLHLPPSLQTGWMPLSRLPCSCAHHTTSEIANGTLIHVDWLSHFIYLVVQYLCHGERFQMDINMWNRTLHSLCPLPYCPSTCLHSIVLCPDIPVLFPPGSWPDTQANDHCQDR